VECCETVELSYGKTREIMEGTCLVVFSIYVASSSFGLLRT